MATLPVHKIHLDEEIEGNIIEVNDLFFHKIGEGVPVISSDFQLDDKFLPFQLIASSDRFQIIFVSNYRGFFLARTKDVIELAKKLKNKENALSVEEICVISVPIGDVSVLALSAESSFISVAVGADVHFYDVNALLNKDKKSCFFYSFKSSSVKDVQWNKEFEKSYMVVLENGTLYNGTLIDPPQLVLEDVDAVAWDMRGIFIAVAKRNIVSILSSKFIEKLSMSLEMKSRTDKSDVNCVKVDSIRWVRPDCIILGCFEMSGRHGKEDNYVVLVLTCKLGEITDVSSRPFVLYFADLFPTFADDIVPSHSRSCLFFSYLEQRELAIFANRRSTDQHILMMGWSHCDGSNDAAVIDIGRDNLRPWIELKENGDDNMVLGMCIDRTSISEKVKVRLGVDEPKLLSPFCVLICLTLDARIVMFYVSSSSTNDAAASLQMTPTVCEGHSDLTCQKGKSSDFFNQKPDANFLESKMSASGHSDNPIFVIKSQSEVKSERQSVAERKQSLPHSTSKMDVFQGPPLKNYMNSSMISGNIGMSGSTETHSGSDMLCAAVPKSSSTKSNFVEPHNYNESENLLLKSYSSRELLNNPCQSELNRKITPITELKLSKKFGNMREITRELDRLLNCIEEPGGFKDECTVKQQDFLITLEQDMETLFEQCKCWKSKMNDQQCTIQNLLERTAQVMARKTYMEGIIKQVKDSQYWDLWGTQKLDSELDKKQEHILELKNNMTSQLNKLEKHFNSLELDKFGVSVRSIKESHGAFHPTRNMRSYHSLHKVMSSQLEAAENHSDYLSRQMTMLGIGTFEKKRKEKIDLFESIGISCESDSFSTPDSKNKADTQHLQRLTPSPASKSRVSNSRHDLESARRRRDSLDRSWVSFEPPTTTLKRVAAAKAGHQSSREEQQSATAKTYSALFSSDKPVSAITNPTAISPPSAGFKREAEYRANPDPPLFTSPLHSSLSSKRFFDEPKLPSKQYVQPPIHGPGKKSSLNPVDPPPLSPDPAPDPLSKSTKIRSALKADPQPITRVDSVPLPPPISRPQPDPPRHEGRPLEPPVTIRPSSANISTMAKTESSEEDVFSSEDEMEEEAPETDQVLPIGLKTLDGLGLGSAGGAPGSSLKAPSPFGGSFPAAFPLQQMTVPSGELFRPASFSVVRPELPPVAALGHVAGTAPAVGGGFGRPAVIGAGQQALGSVLGSFGQSREIGSGFSGAARPGFVNAVGSGGGFSGMGSGGGGFSRMASGGGGFGAFGNQAGMGGFSSGSTVTARPASDLFTQMRK